MVIQSDKLFSRLIAFVSARSERYIVISNSIISECSLYLGMLSLESKPQLVHPRATCTELVGGGETILDKLSAAGLPAVGNLIAVQHIRGFGKSQARGHGFDRVVNPCQKTCLPAQYRNSVMLACKSMQIEGSLRDNSG